MRKLLWNKVAKPLLYYLSIWGGIIVGTFILFHAANESPARIILGANADPAQIVQLEKKLGLDQPKLVQLAGYFGRVVQMDFGRSYVDERPVAAEVLRSFKITGLLVLMAIGVLFGYLATVVSLHPVASLRSTLRWIEMSARSIPVFFTGVVVALLCALYYPVVSFSGNLFAIADWLYLLPPACVLAIYPAAVLSEVLRSELYEIDKSLYVTAARNFGVSERVILFKYAMRNTLIPVFSSFSSILPALFTGAFIVEIIFSIPGIGSLLVKSIMTQDFPIIEAIVILNGFIFVATNLGFETAYVFIDPRMRVNHD